MYSDYLDSVSKAFAAQISRIVTNYNFDNGPEFEIALCKVLRSVLPHKYGVCRGFATAPDGSFAGDDILIYDQHVLPVFRDDASNFEVKQRVPIEGVYAYIEAKNCIYLNEPPSSKQSLDHAINQVAKVRKLVGQREPVSPLQVTKFWQFGKNIVVNSPFTHPLPLRNPFFGAVIARNVKFDANDRDVPSMDELHQHFSRPLPPLPEDADFLGLGPSYGALPILSKRDPIEPGVYIDPFMRADGDFAMFRAEDNLLGVFFCTLMAALERIELGLFPWQGVLQECLKRSDKKP